MGHKRADALFIQTFRGWTAATTAAMTVNSAWRSHPAVTESHDIISTNRRVSVHRCTRSHVTVVSARTLADGNISRDDAFKDSFGALEETNKRRPKRMVNCCGELSSRGSKVLQEKLFFFFFLTQKSTRWFSAGVK